MVGAEMPMTSDQVIWSEQNRLHIAYDNCAVAANAGSSITVTITPGASNPATSSIRNGNTILITDNGTGDTSLTIANYFSNINHTFAGNVGTSNRRFLNIIDTPTVTSQRVKSLDVDNAGQDENFQYGQMVGDLA